MKRESFIVYKSFYALIQLLPEKERLKMYESIFNYGFEEKEPTFKDEASKAIWLSILPQLRANNRRYENGLKGKESGKLGGRPKNPDGDIKKTTKITPNETPKQTPYPFSTKTPNENVNENDNVNDNDIFITTTTSNKNNVFVVVEKEFGRTLSSTEIQKIMELEKDYGEEKLVLAVKECCLNNVKKIAYLNGILKNWKDRTIEEIKNEKLRETQPEMSITQQDLEVMEYDWVNDYEE